MGGRSGLAVVLLAALVLAACGDATDQPTETGASSASAPLTTASSTGSTSTRVPSSSVAPTTAVPTTAVPTTAVPSTTTAPPPRRVVDTRNPVPGDAERFLRDGEWFDSAIELADGSVLLAFRSSWFDICTAGIDRVDPSTGVRSRFADGAQPQVSPDGRTVVYAHVRPDPSSDGCTALEPALRELATGVDTVIAFAPQATSGAIAYGHRWSPDGRFVSMSFGFDFSESAGSGVLDVGARSVVSIRMTRDVEIRLNALVGAAAHEPWELYAAAWLTDGSLAAGATCCYGQGDLDRAAAAPWWRVTADGLVRSLADAITDPVLLAQLPPTVFG